MGSTVLMNNTNNLEHLQKGNTSINKKEEEEEKNSTFKPHCYYGICPLKYFWVVKASCAPQEWHLPKIWDRRKKKFDQYLANHRNHAEPKRKYIFVFINSTNECMTNDLCKNCVFHLKNSRDHINSISKHNLIIYVHVKKKETLSPVIRWNKIGSIEQIHKLPGMPNVREMLCLVHLYISKDASIRGYILLLPIPKRLTNLHIIYPYRSNFIIYLKFRFRSFSIHKKRVKFSWIHFSHF